MQIDDFIWLPDLVDKLAVKHNVTNDKCESKDGDPTSISKAQTLEEMGDFWDEHSLADFWDQTHEVESKVSAKRRRRVTLEPDVYQRIEEQGRARGIAPETLVNVWLIERLQQTTG
jgi:hypothetical protein